MQQVAYREQTGYPVQFSEVASEHGASAAQVRLAWTLHRGPNILAIPGTVDPAHLRENVAADGLHLTDLNMSRLDTIR